MTLHYESLDQNQRRILSSLGKLASESGFYLGGGTAVALQIGHRRSVDYDWFTADPFTEPMELAGMIRESGLAIRNTQAAPRTLHLLVEDVRVSFMHYPYPLIDEALRPEWEPFALASLDDLSCMKLSAIAQRGARKDFVDVFAMAIMHKSLTEMLELYKRKYETGDIGHVLAGLAYTDDAQEQPMPEMIWDAKWDDIKLQTAKWVRELAV